MGKRVKNKQRRQLTVHALDIDTQFQRNHLRHLGMQTLPHFGTTMVNQHGAVGIDMDQRPGLVEVDHVK